jgi:hypothetical protein
MRYEVMVKSNARTGYTYDNNETLRTSLIKTEAQLNFVFNREDSRIYLANNV